MASSEQACISTGMGSSLMNNGARFQGTARHPGPTSKGANWLGDFETASRGQTHPSHPDQGREQILSKINTIMKVTAAVQEVGSTEPSGHHTNFSQQLPGVILHFRNPMCWYLQIIFSTEILLYRKHQKTVSFPV